MTDNDIYYEKIEDFYNDMLISMNGTDDKCNDCTTTRKFIFQNIDDKISLIYDCGETSGNESNSNCGPKYEIILPTKVNYISQYESLYKALNNNIDYDILKKYIKFNNDYEKNYDINLNTFDKLKVLFKNINDIEDKNQICNKIKDDISIFKKDNTVLLQEIENIADDTKNEKIKDYIRNNRQIQKLNKNLNDILNDIKTIFVIEKPLIKLSDIDIIDTPEVTSEVTPEVKTPSKSEDKYLNNITDIEKFTDYKDFNFSKTSVKECEQSVSWERLDKAKNPKEYLKIFKQIQTNPKFPSFNQIYFHAGDSLQYQKFGYLKTRLLSYPKDYEVSDNKTYDVYQDYNIDTTYQTFQYLFQKLKKGIYVSFRNGKLDVFLPFSNFDYHNNWSEILKSENPGLLKKMVNDPNNLSDASRWYANNCFFNTEKYKYTEKSKNNNFQEFLIEGDKTVIPLKYFLIYFEKYCNNKDINIPDVDYFFSPRDFPVLRQNYLEPYDKIFPDKKLSEEYIHKNYTPVLSQSGNTNYHDIPVPTEDDMLRISPDIYPSSCKNPYNNIPEFNTKWKDKIDVCVFRGNATGCGITIDTNMRLMAAHLSYKWKKNSSFKNDDGIDVLDAKLTGWNNRRGKLNDDTFQRLNPKKFDFKKDVGKKNFMDILDQSKHKYILNIDGHVKAFRLGNELRMGSVVLLVDSDYTLWFQKRLKPLTHYIPVKNDLSDLKIQLEWCLNNDDLCERIAQNAKLFYDKYLSREATYEYYYNLINNLSKIRKAPIPNMNDNSLSLIVAYRDPGDGSRKAQLDIFLKQMQTMLQNKTNYHIYIIEQESDRDDYSSLSDEYKQIDSRMAKFNLGRLKNIGFQIASKDNKDVENHYYILSDVDLIPSMELLPKYLEYPKNPIHLANMGTRYNLDGKNKYFLGGVLSINKEDFTKSNGYPNNFWGWGGEDDVLSSRLQIKNIDIEKPKESVIDLEEMTFIEKNIILKKNKYKEMQKWEKSCEDNDILYEKYKKHCKNITNENTYKKNGINNIKKLYSITDRTDDDKVSHVKVYLNIDASDVSDDSTSVSSIPKLIDTHDKPDIDIYDKPDSDKPDSDDKIVEGSKVEFTVKDKKIVGEVIEFTKKRDKCRICCKPGKTKADSGAFYMVPIEKLTLVKKSSEEENVVEEQLDSPSNIIVGSNVKWTKNGKTLTGKVERITKNSYKICCKPGKNSGDSGSLYMVPIKDVQLNKV